MLIRRISVSFVIIVLFPMFSFHRKRAVGCSYIGAPALLRPTALYGQNSIAGAIIRYMNISILPFIVIISNESAVLSRPNTRQTNATTL